MVSVRRENIILYNVLNQEIVFEEYFCNLLSFKKFRELFLEFIATKNEILIKEDIKYGHFDTEVILDSGCGRADLFLKVGDQEFIFEIKHKDATKLTDNQPSQYLRYLKYTNKHLFFLIPKSYQHKDEIIEKWKNFDDVENQIFYWQDFILKMKNEKFEEIEIKMFYDFCIYWFNMKPITFADGEKQLLTAEGEKVSSFKNISVPKLMQKLESIVINIAGNTYMKRYDSILGLCYFKKVGDYIIWFGLDYAIWETKELPLTIVLKDQTKDDDFFELVLPGIELEGFRYKETNTDNGEFVYIVQVKEEIDSVNYQHEVESIIHEIEKQLKKAKQT